RGGTRLPRVDRYTVWNEPNRAQYFEPQGIGGLEAPRAYARLMSACAPAIHAANLRATVALGPLASRGDHGLPPLRFLGAYNQADGPAPDAIAFNPYMNGLEPDYVPGEQNADGSVTLRNVDQLELAARALAGREIPVWLTEFAWRTAPTPHMGTITPEQQSE